MTKTEIEKVINGHPIIDNKGDSLVITNIKDNKIYFKRIDLEKNKIIDYTYLVFYKSKPTNLFYETIQDTFLENDDKLIYDKQILEKIKLILIN
jgi:hypothetical protein